MQKGRKQMPAGIESAEPAARLAATRAQLQQLLAIEDGARVGGLRRGVTGRFPRSATFRLLSSGRDAVRSGA